jgi:AmiR/NasT family two-component response regulator
VEQIFMQTQSAAGASAPLPNPLRPTRVYTRQACSYISPPDEVQRLKAELAKVKGELRELKRATQQFVRSTL